MNKNYFVFPGQSVYKIITTLITILVLVSYCNSQETGSKYLSGKARFIIPSLGTVMVFDLPDNTTYESDSVKANSISGLIDLVYLINKATHDSSGRYKGFHPGDATKIGIIGNYNQQNTLFYCTINDANDLFIQRISEEDFIRRIQIVPLSDYLITIAGKETKTFMEFIKMEHPFYLFPVRISLLVPFGVSDGFTQNLGFEISNIWSRPKSVVNFKFQVSMIWLIHKEEEFYERYIIPSYNMGIGFNFLGDMRFNLKPYFTVGWNPVYYYFNSDDISTTSPRNLKNTWYLNSCAINYGIDLEGWILKRLGISISIEQSKYLAALVPDIYGSSKAIPLDYFTFKIGLIF